jgi:hypothetical protein
MARGLPRLGALKARTLIPQGMFDACWYDRRVASASCRQAGCSRELFDTQAPTVDSKANGETKSLPVRQLGGVVAHSWRRRRQLRVALA